MSLVLYLFLLGQKEGRDNMFSFSFTLTADREGKASTQTFFVTVLGESVEVDTYSSSVSGDWQQRLGLAP